MDNITHSLAGLAIAEGFLFFRRKKHEVSPRLARTAWVTSLVANNLGDLDFLYTGITGGKLGYLLHHRGHTHTVPVALLQSVLVLALTYLFWRRKGVSFTRGEWRWLSLIVFLGPLAHISMDALNSYGVHPFWPFDNTWYYLDTLFIIEPSLWVTLAIGVGFSARSSIVKALCGLVVVAALALSLITGFVPLPNALFLIAWAALLSFVFYRRRNWVAYSTLGLTVSIIAVFFLASWEARGRYRTRMVLTPFPANPICWAYLDVDEEKGDYRLRRGTLSLVNGVQCPELRADPTVATPYHMWVDDLKRLYREHCGVRAFLQFSRAPWVQIKEREIMVGDARFDRSRGPDFAEVTFPAEMKECPKWLPPWKPPLSWLLE